MPQEKPTASAAAPSVPATSVTSLTAKLTPIVTTLEHKHDETEPTPTDLWGPAIGRGPRPCNDPIVRSYRLAVGIAHISASEVNPGDLEDGCGIAHRLPPLNERRGKAVGLYQLVLKSQRRKDRLHGILDILLYVLYIVQVIFGASLTALGPSAGGHPLAITILGLANTVIASVLALIRGQSLPERFRKDEMEFRKVRDFIEETEALLVAGICGKDLQDVGRLVEMTFKMYNMAKLSEENNRPGSYVRQGMPGGKAASGGSL